MEPFADTQLRQQLAAVVEQQGEQIARMTSLFEKIDRVFDAQAAVDEIVRERLDSLEASFAKLSGRQG